MKFSLGMAVIILFLVSCGTPRKKTLELESRIAELEQLLENYQEPALNQSKRLEKAEEEIVFLVQNLNSEVLKTRIQKTITVPVLVYNAENKLEKVPDNRPDTPARQEQIRAVEKQLLPIIAEKPETAHRTFSQRLRKDGLRIEKELESPVVSPVRKFVNKSHPLLHRKLPQSRFIGPDGKVFDLNDFKGRRNILLVFMRGFAGQVCIACSAQTAVLARTHQKFIDENTQIIVVYPGPPSSVPSFLKAVKDLESSFELPFPVLLDVNLTAVKKYNITGDLAKPTSIVIDREGVVQFAYTGKKYDDRPPVRHLLAKIHQINSGAK